MINHENVKSGQNEIKEGGPKCSMKEKGLTNILTNPFLLLVPRPSGQDWTQQKQTAVRFSPP
jgi:hypothetical protein